MRKETKRTYASFTEWKEKSKQTEYTAETPLLDKNGNLLAKGWARHNYFSYDRNLSKPSMRKKEWDFYQIVNDRYLAQISFANISLGGYVGAKLVDWRNGEIIVDAMAIFIGGKNRRSKQRCRNQQCNYFFHFCHLLKIIWKKSGFSFCYQFISTEED